MFERKKKRQANQFKVAEQRARLSRGDAGDGGLMIVTSSGEACLYAPHEVTHPMRYALSRLQSSGKGDVPTTVAVTAALAGEGVSFVAATLAAVLSNDLERTVCLVDLNWWGAALSTSSAGTSPDETPGQVVGVAQVAAGVAVLDTALVPTVNPQLWLLPCGSASQAQWPILARSTGLASVIEELASRFDHVVLDMPPVLAVGESITMVGLAESYLLVVREGVTPDHDVLAAMRDLDHVTLVGVVLNRVVSRVPRRVLRLFAA